MAVGYFLMMLLFLWAYYFKFMLSSMYLNVGVVFYYKNLIKKNSKLNLLFVGKKCNFEHPRLKPVAISFFIGIIMTIISLLNVIVSLCNDQYSNSSLMKIFSMILFYGLLILMAGSIIYCLIMDAIGEKQLEKFSHDELSAIRFEIEKEWPNFFSNQI